MLVSNTFLSYHILPRSERFIPRNLSIKPTIIRKVPEFNQEILRKWGNSSSSSPYVLSSVPCKVILFSKYIQIDINKILNNYFSRKILIIELFEDSDIKELDQLKRKTEFKQK